MGRNDLFAVAPNFIVRLHDRPEKYSLNYFSGGSVFLALLFPETFVR